MGLIDTLGAALANWGPRHTPAPQNSLPLPAIVSGTDEWASLTGNFSGSVSLGEKQALTVSAIYGCVNLIGGAVSGLPLNQYKRSGDAPERFEDGLDTIFNTQMCPRWSAPSGWELLMQSLLLPGDGFARIIRDGVGAVTGLEPLRWSRVQPFVTTDGSRLGYQVAPDPYAPAPGGPGTVVYDQDDILHFPGFGFDGLRGLSPLRYALRVAGSVASATQDYAAEFFRNSARGDYYLATDATLDPEDFERMQEQLREAHGQAGRRHLPMILTSGLTVQALTLPFEDIQMLATRQFQVEEIARIYGVPPFMIGHTQTSTSWGSGVEAMGTGFVRYALRQHLTKIEAEINRKIYRSRRKFVEFDTHALEKADMMTLYEALRIGIGRAGENGFLTVDEVRAVLRYPTMGADKLAIGMPPNAGVAADPRKR